MRDVLHGCSSHDPDPLAIHSQLAPGEKNKDVLFHLAGRLDFKREVRRVRSEGMGEVGARGTSLVAVEAYDVCERECVSVS